MKKEDLKPDKFYVTTSVNKPVYMSWQFMGYLNHRPIFKMYNGIMEETKSYLAFEDEDVERLRELDI